MQQSQDVVKIDRSSVSELQVSMETTKRRMPHLQKLIHENQAIIGKVLTYTPIRGERGHKCFINEKGQLVDLEDHLTFASVSDWWENRLKKGYTDEEILRVAHLAKRVAPSYMYGKDGTRLDSIIKQINRNPSLIVKFLEDHDGNFTFSSLELSWKRTYSSLFPDWSCVFSDSSKLMVCSFSPNYDAGALKTLTVKSDHSYTFFLKQQPVELDRSTCTMPDTISSSKNFHTVMCFINNCNICPGIPASSYTDVISSKTTNGNFLSFSGDVLGFALENSIFSSKCSKLVPSQCKSSSMCHMCYSFKKDCLRKLADQLPTKTPVASSHTNCRFKSREQLESILKETKKKYRKMYKKYNYLLKKKSKTVIPVPSSEDSETKRKNMIPVTSSEISDKKRKTKIPVTPSEESEKRKTIIPVPPSKESDKKRKTMFPVTPSEISDKKRKTMIPITPSEESDKKRKTMFPVTPSEDSGKKRKNMIPVTSSEISDKKRKTMIPITPSKDSDKKRKTMIPVTPSEICDKKRKTMIPITPSEDSDKKRKSTIPVTTPGMSDEKRKRIIPVTPSEDSDKKRITIYIIPAPQSKDSDKRKTIIPVSLSKDSDKKRKTIIPVTPSEDSDKKRQTSMIPVTPSEESEKRKTTIPVTPSEESEKRKPMIPVPPSEDSDKKRQSPSPHRRIVITNVALENQRINS